MTFIDIIDTLITIILAVAMYYGRGYLVAHTGAKTASVIESLAFTAVAAVEQMLSGKATSADKKLSAVSILKDLLAAQKLNVSEDTISAAIEAAVLKLNREQPIAISAIAAPVAPAPAPAPAQAS